MLYYTNKARGTHKMAISADEIRGHTDSIILARLAEGDSYGYEIGKAVRTLSGGLFEMKEATLYTAFRRMEAEGLIESYWGESDIGARRRYYHITAKGRMALIGQTESWHETKEILDKLLSCGGNENA